MSAVQESMFPAPRASIGEADVQKKLEVELAGFDRFGKRTVRDSLPVVVGGKIPLFVNEFWTSRQRAASSLHEISYRACFKPQLPRFFIERLTGSGEIVYDPFMGRGTTLVEAALLGRTPFGCDVNPLSAILVRARLSPPGLMQIRERLEAISFADGGEYPEDLLAFYHPETLKEICALKRYLQRRKERDALDGVDHWIWMVATNRLTGHSPGFFSVYTLPPNQAVSVDSQVKINQKRGQKPPRRSVPGLILRKSEQLLADVDDAVHEQLLSAATNALLLTKSSDNTPEIQANSVALVVTSPPFLDVVDYRQDNWLRAWFCGIDAAEAAIWQKKDLATWEESMAKVLTEIRRVVRPDGWVAFEVGEIRNGRIKLETSVLKVGVEAGLHPVLGLINDQVFTKTSNCWGVQNLRMGTNTNRIILFQKRAGF